MRWAREFGLAGDLADKDIQLDCLGGFRNVKCCAHVEGLVLQVFDAVQIIPLGFSGRDLEELPLTRYDVNNPGDVARPYPGHGNESVMILSLPVCADAQD
ncbi:MAG: hypothetical protein ACXQS5_02920 [Candidatus Methanospirareceae archaeon]